MARKFSSPMAPNFMVSAPGKVIVFGEHAAVYGKPVIAAAISLRSYLFVNSLSKSQRTVTLNFKDIGLYHTWEIDTLPWSLFQLKDMHHCSPVRRLDPELLQSIIPHAEAVSQGTPESDRKVHIRSATAFLYLYLSLGCLDSPGIIFTLRSTIPIGAGLGVSASVCLCLSAALLLHIHALAGPHPNQPAKEAELQIERINNWAFVGELCIHGDPSGVDNAVSTGGKAVVYQRNLSGSPTVTPLATFPSLRLLLVDTNQPRSTAAQVDKVGALKQTLPGMTHLILDGIGQITNTALQFIRSDFDDKHALDALEQLGSLIRMNHGILVSLGVSHPRLGRVRELVAYADIGWTKLTGAGGGGCAITLFRAEVADDTIEGLRCNLNAEGFEVYQTAFGTDGVGVLWPAVLRNGLDGETDKENDLEAFEQAAGVHAIERIVGVEQHDHWAGWKFWKPTTV